MFNKFLLFSYAAEIIVGDYCRVPSLCSAPGSACGKGRRSGLEVRQVGNSSVASLAACAQVSNHCP